MNLNNIEFILQRCLLEEGIHFEEWYYDKTGEDIEVFKNTHAELEDVQGLIDELISQNKVNHIYFNYLLLLKDWINEH